MVGNMFCKYNECNRDVCYCDGCDVRGRKLAQAL